MPKTTISTEAAPAAIGPYSQAVRAGQFLFVSGQIALDPATGELSGPGIEEQTTRCLENLKAILAAGNSSLDKVVKVTVFLQDLADFERMNQVYAGYFASQPPARACVQVARLPRAARIEIEAVALAE